MDWKEDMLFYLMLNRYSRRNIRNKKYCVQFFYININFYCINNSKLPVVSYILYIRKIYSFYVKIYYKKM